MVVIMGGGGGVGERKRWVVLFPLLATSFASCLLLLVPALLGRSSLGPALAGGGAHQAGQVVGDDSPFRPGGVPPPPRFAYLMQGSKGDGPSLRRLLLATYHPRNLYLLHLDRDAGPTERLALARFVKSHPLLRDVGNVHVVGKANLVTHRGPSMIASILHGAAILLKFSPHWDWFINLSAADYPLITQDDLLHVFSYLPKDLNFIEHTSDIGWKEFQRAKPMVIDPALYMKRKSDIFWVTQRRPLPVAFKLFTGSTWVVLSRAFLEYCILGWDNLPRTMLMYYTNFVSSMEGYFHTVICNTREFRNTTVNHDLHFIEWDNPPKELPHTLGLSHFKNLSASGAVFARAFLPDDPVLDKIDKHLLGRSKNFVTPGGWCVGPDSASHDPCITVGDLGVLKPGPGAKRLETLVLKQLSEDSFRDNQCAMH